MKVHTTEENLYLIKKFGASVHTGYNEYLFMPFWIRRLDENTCEIFRLKDAPQDLQLFIKEERAKDEKSVSNLCNFINNVDG